MVAERRMRARESAKLARRSKGPGRRIEIAEEPGDALVGRTEGPDTRGWALRRTPFPDRACEVHVGASPQGDSPVPGRRGRTPRDPGRGPADLASGPRA